MECAETCMANLWLKSGKNIYAFEVRHQIKRNLFTSLHFQLVVVLKFLVLYMFYTNLDKMYWTHGYGMIAKNVVDSVPVFLLGLANDIFVCGKSINLLRLCSPRVCNFFCLTTII